jgi:hypothetical protein
MQGTLAPHCICAWYFAYCNWRRTEVAVQRGGSIMFLRVLHSRLSVASTTHLATAEIQLLQM